MRDGPKPLTAVSSYQQAWQALGETERRVLLLMLLALN